jgi:hypothetical protein
MREHHSYGRQRGVGRTRVRRYVFISNRFEFSLRYLAAGGEGVPVGLIAGVLVSSVCGGVATGELVGAGGIGGGEAGAGVADKPDTPEEDEAPAAPEALVGPAPSNSGELCWPRETEGVGVRIAAGVAPRVEGALPVCGEGLTARPATTTGVG